MADVLTQIQQRQAREQNQELATAQHDLDWNSTFGRMAPDSVLRETRNMTALIANAVEKKMELAAQTSAEAQRIYINDQRWKAEQRMQPMKDERLKAQIRTEEARAAAAEAKELLDLSRQEREARTVAHTASAQWELDKLEGSPLPEADKRAWLSSVRGKYPAMDKETVDRYDAIHGVLNPKPVAVKPANPPTPDQQGFIARYGDAVKGVEQVKPWLAAAGLNLGASAEDLAVAARAGKITPEQRDVANHWLTQFKGASGKETTDKDYDAHFNEVSGKLKALTTSAPASSTPSASTTAAPAADRTELARRALADPNASEAHKAAARKILGQ